MQKWLGYLLTPLHLLVFGLVLLVFEVIQRLAHRLGGYAWHKRSVDLLNYCLMRSLWVLGTHPRFYQPHALPTDRPLIVVSNHQSLHDIPPFFWYLRRHHIKFVSKIELGRGIPSISYNLRHGGSVLIDRKNPRQAIPAIKEFADFIGRHNYAAVIFPEGTRSRNGTPKHFSTQGLKTLLKYTPQALILPVTINGAWQLQRYGWFPMPVGVQPTWQVHAPIDPKGRSPEEVLAEVEATIKGAVAVPLA